MTEIEPQPKIYSHAGRWLQFGICPRERAGWFRLIGFGLRWVDHRIDRPLFSERYNGRYGIRKRAYLHLGPFCLLGLRPGAR